MDFEDLLLTYIKPMLLVLVPILWYLGLKIKDTNKIQDAWIPFILMAISIVIALSYVLIFEEYSPAGVWIGVMQGFAIAVFQGWLFQAKRQIEELRR
jgi:uncharacterized membrane protein YagU involved in acid resistance